MQKKSVYGLVSVALWLGAGAATAFAAGEDGQKVFEAKKCIACHSLGTQKGAMAKVGGALDGVGSKRDAAWLKAYLSDPKSKIPDAKMPKGKYTDAELDALVQYISSLK